MAVTSNAGLDLERRIAARVSRAPRPPRSPWRSRISRWDVKYTPYLLISPFFIIFTIFGLFPLLYNGVVSLRTWRLDDPAADGWAGLANYRQLLTDTDFRDALINTFGIFLLSTIPQLFMALIVASVLNRRLRMRTTLRVGVLLPYITPLAASTLVFAAIFARDAGVVNSLLSAIGVAGPDWQEDKYWSWVAIAIMVNWRWVGYNALIYLGAMQSVPRDLYEAASLDGASPWQQLWKITVPMIRPTLIFTIVLSTIGGMQLFTEPLLFNKQTRDATGGSDGQFNTVALMIYKTGWKDLNLGYAAAMAWALFAVILLLAGLNAFIANRRVAGGKS